jgi:hypothetical protein
MRVAREQISRDSEMVKWAKPALMIRKVEFKLLTARNCCFLQQVVDALRDSGRGKRRPVRWSCGRRGWGIVEEVEKVDGEGEEQRTTKQMRLRKIDLDLRVLLQGKRLGRSECAPIPNTTGEAVRNTGWNTIQNYAMNTRKKGEWKGWTHVTCCFAAGSISRGLTGGLMYQIIFLC